jgi:hypothetical protein
MLRRVRPAPCQALTPRELAGSCDGVPASRVAGAINALPAAQPGAINCPADFGVTVHLTFRPRRAVAVVDPSGCGGVTLTLHGRRRRRSPAVVS